jgi:hypothetical protein
MSHLLNIFLEPGKVFADLREKPSFLLPMLLSVSAMVALMLLYFGSVDPAWYADYAVRASGKEMSAAEIAQMKQVMPGARTMGYFLAPSAAIMIVLVALVYALYLMLAGKVAGLAVSFKQGLALTSWSSMPNLIGAIVAIIGVLTMDPKTPMESLMLTNVDPLLVQLPLDHAWSGFAKGFSLLNLWAIGLLALGWRLWSRGGWGQAIFVAALPSLVIYGIWALIAFLK